MMNIYYVKFECEFNNAIGSQSLATIERVIYANNEASIEGVLSHWYTFANAYDDDLPNLETVICLGFDADRKKQGSLTMWKESWWLHQLKTDDEVEVNS